MKTLWILVLATVLALAGWSCSGKKSDQSQTKDQAAMEQEAESPAPAADEAQPPAPTKEPPAAASPEKKPARQETPAKPMTKEELSEAARQHAAQTGKPAEPAMVTRLVPLAPGSDIGAELDETISTETHPAGRSFSTTLREPVARNGAVILPAGSKVRGNVSFSKRAARVGGKAQMTLEFKELTTPDGKTYTLFADPLVLEGKSTGSGDLQKVLGGAVGGAIVGGILGGKGGAVKGGAAGGAAGAAWAVATRGNDIVLEQNQKLEITLNRELQVPVTVPAGQALP